MLYSDKITEQKLAELEGRLTALYRDTYAEMTAEAQDYFSKFAERYKKELAAFQKGEAGYSDPATAQKKFNEWYAAQVGRGDKWLSLRDSMADRLTAANEIAAAYINDTTPEIFSINANFGAYQIEKYSKDVSFSLVNERTIEGLMAGRTQILPVSRVATGKDKAWNEKQLENALTRGILQGYPVGKMAQSFERVAQMDHNSAVRNARTAITCSQNAGRQYTYDAAAEMGLVVYKEWIATADERTRESHAELDGVQVPYDKDFPNGLQYPAEAGGDPSEIYNCRCTMRALITGVNDDQRTGRVPMHEEPHDEQTYKAWLDAKREAEKENKPYTHADATHRANEKKGN